jgi:hypothetical protein
MNQPSDCHGDRRDRIRTAREIAARTLALFGIVGIGLRAPRENVVAWLKETSIWQDLSPGELSLVETRAPTDRMMIDASWRSEALTMLLWTLEKIRELPPADMQCDTSLFQQILPPYAEITEEQFLATATRRSDEELRLQAESCMNLHAEYYAAARDGKPPRQPVDGGIIRERHHAINWVIGYEGLDWDLVTTDI